MTIPYKAKARLCMSRSICRPRPRLKFHHIVANSELLSSRNDALPEADLARESEGMMNVIICVGDGSHAQ